MKGHQVPQLVADDHPLAKQIELVMRAAQESMIPYLAVQYEPRRKHGRPSAKVQLAGFLLQAVSMNLFPIEDGHTILVHAKGSSVEIVPIYSGDARELKSKENQNAAD